MTSMETVSHDAMVLAYILRLAQTETDPMLKAHDLDLIEKAKLLAQRDLMQAEIDRLKGTTLQAVPNSDGDANEG